MRRIHSYGYQHRSILLLLPLMLLAICTWALSYQVMPLLELGTRNYLLLSARIFFPGLFVLMVAFVVPTVDRFLQLSVVAFTYVVSLLCLPGHAIDFLTNPMICVVTSVSTLFALLPYQNGFEDTFVPKPWRLVSTCFFVTVLPTITFVCMVLILRQINTFILYTFEQSFGQSLLSVIYVPLYLLLQTVGAQDLVGSLITLRYQNTMVTAFVNAIVMTNLVALPTTLFVRSFFTKRHVRLFMTLLVIIAIMTGSIGSCVSLTLLLLLIFFPGSFSTLLITGMSCFIMSYLLEIPPITVVQNLYLPDTNLALTTMALDEANSLVAGLEAFALILPAGLVLFSMFIRRERIRDRKRKLRSLNFGYTTGASSSPELNALAFLRALGGMSNIVDIAVDGAWLYIQVVSHEGVSLSSLNTLVQEKVVVDRATMLYLCNVGEQSQFLHLRLSKFLENPMGEAQYDVPVSVPFHIQPMPHHHSATPAA